MTEHLSEVTPSILTMEASLMVEFQKVASNDRGEPSTWGATPLVLSSDIVEQQHQIQRQLAELFETTHIPPYVSEELAEYIYVLNMSRTYNREEHNRNSFVYRGKTDMDGMPLESLEVLERAMAGFASPAELLLIAREFEIPTIELASLTHPYDQRIELLEPMRLAVSEAIELLDGTLTPNRPAEYEVKGSDNLGDPSATEGIHMTRKRFIGVLPDGTEIIERSSFVILVDALPGEIADRVHSTPYGEQWAKQVCSRHDMETLIPLLNNSDSETAISVSTTVVAINHELDKKLLSEEAMRIRNRQYVDMHRSMI